MTTLPLRTAVLVTHDVDEALYLADRVVVIDGSPARRSLELIISASLRRSRYADLSDERMKLFAALGVDRMREMHGRSNLRVAT